MSDSIKTETSAVEIQVQQQPVVPAANQAGGTQLPSVQELFIQSWERLKDGALNALLVTLISFVANLLVLTLSAGVFIGITTSKLPFSEIQQTFTNKGVAAVITELGSTFGIALTTSLALLLILSVLIGAIGNGAVIYAFALTENKPSLGAIFQAAFKKIGWLILTNLVMFLIFFGSFWAFCISLFILSIFFSLTTYEVLLGEKNTFSALRSSVSIVANNFGAYVGRWLLVILGYILISFVVPGFFSRLGGTVSAGYSIINVFVNYILGMYTVAYAVTLYKHCKTAAAQQPEKTGLTWGLISVSLFGWILFFFAIGMIMRLIGSNLTELEKNLSARGSNSSSHSQDTASADDLAAIESQPVKTSCDLSMSIPMTTGADKRYWIYEERMVESAAFHDFATPAQLKNGVQAGFLSYKSSQDRLPNTNSKTTFNINFPGYRVYCVANTGKIDLAKFVANAQASKKFSVTLTDSQRSIGDLLIQPVAIAGLTKGDYYNENAYLGVTPGDNSQLVIITPVGPTSDDADSDSIYLGLQAIENSFKVATTPSR